MYVELSIDQIVFYIIGITIVTYTGGKIGSDVDPIPVKLTTIGRSDITWSALVISTDSATMRPPLLGTMPLSEPHSSANYKRWQASSRPCHDYIWLVALWVACSGEPVFRHQSVRVSVAESRCELLCSLRLEHASDNPAVIRGLLR